MIYILSLITIYILTALAILVRDWESKIMRKPITVNWFDWAKFWPQYAEALKWPMPLIRLIYKNVKRVWK